jgi:hypothetical protein
VALSLISAALTATAVITGWIFGWSTAVRRHLRARRHPCSGPAKCACGETFATLQDLEDHFCEMLMPEDDIGVDGLKHFEIWNDKQSPYYAGAGELSENG